MLRSVTATPRHPPAASRLALDCLDLGAIRSRSQSVRLIMTTQRSNNCVTARNLPRRCGFAHVWSAWHWWRCALGWRADHSYGARMSAGAGVEDSRIHLSVSRSQDVFVRAWLLRAGQG
jgi:hypothetical protein